MFENPAINSLLQAYVNTGLVIDTNLLLLDFVGDYDSGKITSFKRTRAYTIEDYRLLKSILVRYPKIIVNQPILAEAFNLLDSLNSQLHYSLHEHLAKRLQKFSEVHKPKDEIIKMRSFNKYGFTDASIDLLSNFYLVLTDDLRLYHYLATQVKPVINFNHIRNFT